MANDEAPDWAKREIQEAVNILKSDGVHIHKTYAAFQKTLTEKPAEGDGKTPEPPAEPDTEGTPPPAGAGNEKAKRKSVWWGDRL
jgi:hypothetical protein